MVDINMFNKNLGEASDLLDRVEKLLVVNSLHDLVMGCQRFSNVILDDREKN